MPIITMLKRSALCKQPIVARDEQNLAHDLARREERSRPISAVMQNLQSTGQPTWLEMQTVSRSPSGIRTVSTVRPSLSRSR